MNMDFLGEFKTNESGDFERKGTVRANANAGIVWD